jgi:MFS superfamily sulfate permease-like transporter
MKQYFKSLKYDLPAGLVVALVALPLCLGIALASGAPFFSGMIAGIIGGVVIGIISNGQLSVSGPAAGLTAIVLTSIATLGSFNSFLLAVVLAGIGQIALGFIKAGRIAEYFPSNVIKGMLTAIGIIIILKQIPHAVGYDKDAEGDMSFLQTDHENTFSEIYHLIGHIDISATILCAISLIIIYLWNTPTIKKTVGMLPGGLVAVLVSVLINELFFKQWNGWGIAEEHLVNVPIAHNFGEFMQLFTMPDFSQLSNPNIYGVAATIMIVASIETLLCIEAIDKIDPEKRVTNGNLELIAQGIGNIISGMIGGLPITSVIVRSSANLQAGGKTKVSSIVHGLFLLICVAFIPGLLNKIPLASLAAILLYTGFKLCSPSIFMDMFKHSKYQYIPFIITVVAIVFTDLLMGVGVGLVVSIAAILIGNFKNSYFFHQQNYHSGETITIKLSQEVSFLNKAAIKQTLEHLPKGSKVKIDASETRYIDFDVLEIIREFKQIRATIKNIDCQLVNFKDIYNIENTASVHSH